MTPSQPTNQLSQASQQCQQYQHQQQQAEPTNTLTTGDDNDMVTPRPVISSGPTKSQRVLPMLYRHVPGEGRDPVPLSLLPSFTTTASPRGASQHMSALIGFRATQRLPPFFPPPPPCPRPLGAQSAVRMAGVVSRRPNMTHGSARMCVRTGKTQASAADVRLALRDWLGSE